MILENRIPINVCWNRGRLKLLYSPFQWITVLNRNLNRIYIRNKQTFPYLKCEIVTVFIRNFINLDIYRGICWRINDPNAAPGNACYIRDSDQLWRILRRQSSSTSHNVAVHSSKAIHAFTRKIWVPPTTETSKTQQECIPVGCVPSAVVTVPGDCLPKGCLPGLCLPARGVFAQGGDVCLPGVCLPAGRVSACQGVWQTPPSPVNSMTDTCKNITLPQLCCRR